MTWLKVGKGLLGMFVSYGVGNIVGNIIKKTTPIDLNTFNKVSINVAGFAVASMISDKTITYLNEEIDRALHIDNEHASQ